MNLNKLNPFWYLNEKARRLKIGDGVHKAWKDGKYKSLVKAKPYAKEVKRIPNVKVIGGSGTHIVKVSDGTYYTLPNRYEDGMRFWSDLSKRKVAI